MKKILAGFVEFFGSLFGVRSVIDRPLRESNAALRQLGTDRGSITMAPDFDEVNADITALFEESDPESHADKTRRYPPPAPKPGDM